METLRLISANMKSVKPTHVEASRDVGVIAIMETFNLDNTCLFHSLGQELL
jgi:hypothetical protein